mmetsp:Transcript_18021/g.2941  ORF Transcript_18021/g.2941 Transcript_18021/m.2941 type:complete len:98 (+) Transcript_18021:244-537(+)
MLGILKDNYALFLLLPTMLLPVLCAFACEKFVFGNVKNPRLLAIFTHTVIILAEIIVPFYVIWQFRGNVFLNIYTLSLAAMISMKLTSYAHVMGDLR